MSPPSAPARWLVALDHASSVPDGDAWLGDDERVLLRALKVPKRRDDFRLGRFVVKRLLQRMRPERALTELQVLPDAEGAPRAFAAGRALPCTISLSHRGAFGFAALHENGLALGCDLELVEARSAAFMRDYFTQEEQRIFAARPTDAPMLWANLFWSAKESALKAQRVGLRRDARELEVTLEAFEVHDERWAALRVKDLASRRDFNGYWQRRDELLLTVVTDERLPPPAVE